MPRFDVPLHVEIEAENKNAAFAYVRTHYGVVDDPKREVTTHGVDFHVDEPIELAEGEFVID